MKAKYFLLCIASIALLATSCEKPSLDEEISSNPGNNGNNGNNNGNAVYNFTNYQHSYVPEQPVFISATLLRTDATLGTIYTYNFSMSLHNFATNPATIYASGGTFYITSVYKGGVMMFTAANSTQYWYDRNTNIITSASNVTDHAGFAITSISDGRMYFSVTTATMSSTSGCDLKFIATEYNGTLMEWAHRPGGVNPNDIFYFNFNNGVAKNMWQ